MPPPMPLLPGQANVIEPIARRLVEARRCHNRERIVTSHRVAPTRSLVTGLTPTIGESSRPSPRDPLALTLSEHWRVQRSTASIGSQ